MPISTANVATPVAIEAIAAGDVVLAEREGSWYVGLKFNAPGMEDLVLLRQIGGEDDKRVVPRTVPSRYFSFYAVQGPFVARPKSILSPQMDNNQPEAGALMMDESGSAYLRREDGGSFSYVDLQKGSWIASPPGEHRIFYKEWQLIRRVGDDDEVLVSYPEHRSKASASITALSA